MIAINKEEAIALIAKYGSSVKITITSRNKKGGRKKYYAPEEWQVVNFINKYRNEHLRHLLQEV